MFVETKIALVIIKYPQLAIKPEVTKDGKNCKILVNLYFPIYHSTENIRVV